MNKYGRLTILKHFKKDDKPWVVYICDCGNKGECCKYNITRKNRPTISCGCARKNKRPTCRKWNLDKAISISNKYNKWNDFIKKEPRAYDFIIRNNLYSKIPLHKTANKVKNKYPYSKIKKEIEKYEFSSDFIKDNYGMYRAAKRNGWWEDLSKKLKLSKNSYHRYVYIYEFEDGSAYIGITWNYKERHKNHLSDSRSPVYKKNKKNIKYNIIRNHKPINIKSIGEIEAKTISEYKKNGWVVLNKAKAGGLGTQKRKWTLKKCKKIALKYNSKKKLVKDFPAVELAARKYGWWKEITKHMPKDIRMKQVMNITTGEVYNDTREAANKLNTSIMMIQKVCRGKDVKSTKGCELIYLDEYSK